MKRLLVSIIIILTIAGNSYCQKAELYTGALLNHYFDCIKPDPHQVSKYKDKWGYSIGVAIDSLKFEWHTLRIAVQYDHYGGGFYYRSGGRGGSSSVEGQIEKGVLSLSIYPVNVRKLVKNMQLSVGLTGSLFLYESFSGEYNSWSAGQGTSTGRIEDKYSSLSSNLTIGIQSLINYRIRVSSSLEIVPQYSFYFGLSKELKERSTEMKSIRHYFMLGLRKRIK